MKIFIMGGTSGIGQELARRYLEMGNEVGICGRNLEKSELPENPNLKRYALDVYDKKDLQKAVKNFADEHLDMMIISTGTYTESIVHKLTYEESEAMLKTNLTGTINAFEVARQAMKKSGGHIVAIASVSALLDYPQSSLYSKTKRIILQLCEAYRCALQDFGISVTAIAPGYVDTPKLRELKKDDLSKMPFVISCEKACDEIIKAISDRKELVIFPKKMKRLMMFLSFLPKGLLRFIMKKKAQWTQPE
ncbi:SDR family NAD(P)-dependent oxidoreductase [Weeksellaceae bacterium TAE3-ERU29]|nr:SDR family NAD(P)-dependent oxidoreductase [Weeksellaceae bacterium TAE3-ERU29]